MLNSPSCLGRALWALGLRCGAAVAYMPAFPGMTALLEKPSTIILCLMDTSGMTALLENLSRSDPAYAPHKRRPRQSAYGCRSTRGTYSNPERTSEPKLRKLLHSCESVSKPCHPNSGLKPFNPFRIPVEALLPQLPHHKPMQARVPSSNLANKPISPN